VIDFADPGEGDRIGATGHVPAGCFTNGWVVDEWDALDPAQSGSAQESLSLVSVEKLTAHEMTEVREQHCGWTGGPTVTRRRCTPAPCPRPGSRRTARDGQAAARRWWKTSRPEVDPGPAR